MIRSFWKYIHSLPGSQRNIWRMRITVEEYKGRLRYIWTQISVYTSQMGQLNDELKGAGRDMIIRCAHESWWFWDIGSRLMF